MRHEYTSRLERASRPRRANGPSISYHEGSRRTMADVPVADRPRERLWRVGAQALADAELIALVIGAGTRARGALAVADDVMAAAGGEVHGLATIGADALKRITGVGGSRASRLLAALELGRRTLAPSAVRPQMRSPEDAARYLAPRYAAFPEERFGVMLLDARHRVLRTTIISTGTADASFVHPRDVFRVAALASAASVVAFHNHPSGDPTPSREDRDVTARLERAGGIMGIDLVDHIILGHGRYFSFREESRK